MKQDLNDSNLLQEDSYFILHIFAKLFSLNAFSDNRKKTEPSIKIWYSTEIQWWVMRPKQSTFRHFLLQRSFLQQLYDDYEDLNYL